MLTLLSVTNTVTACMLTLFSITNTVTAWYPWRSIPVPSMDGQVSYINWHSSGM